MFDETNLNFYSYLLKFLSDRPQYIRSTMTMGLCFFMQNFCVFRIISILFREIFVLFFREIFIFIFSRNFRIIFGKLIKFSHFSRANEMKKFSRNYFFPTPVARIPKDIYFLPLSVQSRSSSLVLSDHSFPSST